MQALEQETDRIKEPWMKAEKLLSSLRQDLQRDGQNRKYWARLKFVATEETIKESLKELQKAMQGFKRFASEVFR